MWEHLTTGTSLNKSSYDPDIFPDHQWTHQTDLTILLGEIFEFVMRRGSVERAVCAALEHLLHYNPPDFRDYRGDWYRNTFPSQTFFSLSNSEEHVVRHTNPLRFAPHAWVERDIAILNSANDVTFEGLRELAAVDVQVGLELQNRLNEVVLPTTGPIAAEVWPADVCRMVESAIGETLQQTLPTGDS